MQKRSKFPYQFFVVTFIWSWLIWLPLVLAGAGILPLGKDLQSTLSIPLISLGAFGPAVGAFYCLRNFTRERCDSRIPARSVGSPFWLEGLADPHPGFRRKHLVGVDAAGTMGSAAPENAAALRLGFSALCFDHDLFRRRTGRAGLARLYFGSAGRETGAVVGESGAGGGLGLLAYPGIFCSGCKPIFYAFCRICVAYGRLFLVLRLGSAIFRKTHPGRVGCPRLVQRVCSPVPYVGDGQWGSAAAFLDLGESDFCNWFGNDDFSFAKNKLNGMDTRRKGS